ncbi:acetyl-CoA C-acetyltransferase [Alphaproteobacteria bacterium]|jgi:acetyl-CoA C-acetyltransferase|nr:acetyl-CoA C-acyltransferase [Rhodobiaceae bacterium]MCH1486749.1 acetyl-CoA C-acetyltransferase [Alphaproteobacteria bacterium]RPF98309.1 MAG: acetyl-CoA C-acyltransferase [Rhizobiales bacterium TMED162]MDA8539632.1 acetyl-CoA C-acetyltransferase [Alphaproteobacteria bacterium]MDA8726020.1 acetyl-CoA C-acetyltransferase [Alphaproteobacteria bacterium]
MAEAYIVAAARTAGGRRDGKLKDWHPADLAGKVINDLLDRSGAAPELVEDVIMGCVSQVGEQAANIGRNAVLASRLPESVPATSVDRQCGSSQQSIHFAAQAVMSGTMDCVIAAGVESMSRVPMGLNISLPFKEGHGFYVSPAMQERYPDVQFSQFAGAEMVAKKYELSKDEIDAYAYRSHERAIAATQAGAFDEEIVPIEVTNEDGDKEVHKVDEGIRFDASLEGIQGVKLLAEGGVITAASSSQICDGASGVMIVNEEGLKQLNVKPLAKIIHLSVMGHDPVVMLEAPIPATKRALDKAGLAVDDIDLFEVNEAFGSVPVAYCKELGVDGEKINVHGGAIALGHPLGGSGTKLMATLVHALKRKGGKYGLQTMCEGGGMANVTIIENLQ